MVNYRQSSKDKTVNYRRMLEDMTQVVSVGFGGRRVGVATVKTITVGIVVPSNYKAQNL